MSRVSATAHFRMYDTEERMTGEVAARKTRVEHSQHKRGRIVVGTASSRFVGS